MQGLPLRRTLFTWLCAGLLVSGPALLLPAQRPATPKDSVAAHEAASVALRNFQYQSQSLVVAGRSESDYIANLFGTCELRVGDFCYGPTNGKLAFGGVGTTHARRLLSSTVLKGSFRRLADAYVNLYFTHLRRQRAIIPGDRWITGEFVRMHIEHGYVGRAEDELKGCKSDIWWCGALRAYVRHISGDWGGADSMWTHVLRDLPPAERCAWLDPSLVVEDAAFVSKLATLPCDERERIANRFWWLADPFFSRAGNERRSAHLARIVSLVLDHAAHKRIWATPAMLREQRFVPTLQPPLVLGKDTPMMKACGSLGDGNYSRGSGIIKFMIGYVDLVTRLGTPYHCGPLDPEELNGGMLAPPGGIQPLVAQYPLHRISFVPSIAAVDAPTFASAEDWNLRNRVTYEFFADWTKPIADLSYQAAYFKRGDSARLVVASDGRPPQPPFTGPSRERMLGSLWLQSDFDKPRFTMARDAAAPLIFAANVRPERTLASVEVNFVGGDLGRVRFGSGPQQMPQQAVTLSDILLLRFADDLPADLAAAERVALGTTRLVEGAAIGIFWEMYGLSAGDSAHVSLMVVRQPGKEPLRLGRSAQRISGTDVVVTEWDERPVSGRSLEPRAINVGLGTLTRGRYTLSLAVSVPGQALVETVRTIEIVQ